MNRYRRDIKILQRPAALNEQGVVFLILNYFIKPIAKEFYMRYNKVGTNLFNGKLLEVELT